MAIESKAEVKVDSLSNDEATELLRAFGAEPVSEPTRLFGGYASSNFKVLAKLDGGESRTYLLKVNYYGLNIEDIEHQLYVMNHLRTTSFPTNYPYQAKSGGFYVSQGGRTAILLDFITGKRGDEVLAADEGKTDKLLSELAMALAQLHKVSWPSDRKLRDIRSGYPLCNTGDLLRGEELETLKANESFKDHPYIAFVDKQTPWLRELYAKDVPWGLIHGDAFLDNTLYEEGPAGSGDCKLLALVDWEDSCIGPYVVDLAVCASACCFTASNDLMRPRLLVLLKEYLRQRKLDSVEVQTFPDFMAAGALACSFYRFCEFNVRQPDSDAKAKEGYHLMKQRAELLLDGPVRQAVVDTLADAMAAAAK